MLKKIFKEPKFYFILFLGRIFPDSLFWDKIYLKMLYKNRMKKKLDLKNPKTYNEKLNWLKINDRNPKYTKMADKYDAKEYVKNIIGGQYIIPTLGIYNKWNEINFNQLPNQFVIKCTHDSGGVIICKDKSKFDYKEAKRKINKSLNRNYYYSGREWPYKNIKPRIIIEKYLEDNTSESIKDYKFYIFNGKLACSFIASDRQTKTKFTFFDKSKKFIDVRQCGADNDPSQEMPIQYEEMVILAEKLGQGIPEIRVDFYVIKNQIYFGELTFFDSSGFGEYEPEEMDYKLGEMLELPIHNGNEGII